MSKIEQLKPCANAAVALRNIADRIESGELDQEATVIVGKEVFHVGCFDDEKSITNAVFNMTFGIQKLMNSAL